MDKKIIFVLIVLCASLLLFGCTQTPASTNSFQSVDNSICKIDGKPVVRMYGTNICPHCIWVGPTYDAVVKKYADENKIVAYHWNWIVTDANVPADDLLTPNFEGTMPASEKAVFDNFSPNGYVPAFVFGCKYYRIGNEFEQQNDLNAERAEFERVIQELLK
ncbi:Uncharacterised protein [uncultured archaeon]|nr:Uncharacterised protein [uncultured archaeon]